MTERTASGLGALVVGALIALVGVGCSASSSSQSAMMTTPAGALDKGTHLWTKTNDAVALPDKWIQVHGVLTVNSKGCFGVGELLLWAPAGATVIDRGEGVDLPGVGAVHVGDAISTKGYVFQQDAARAGVDEVRNCIPGDAVSVVSLYGAATPTD